MKNIFRNILAGLAIVCFTASCSDFLVFNPKGTVTDEMLNSPEFFEDMVVSAYSTLGNDTWSIGFSYPWIYGSVRSDDSFKGGGSVSDQGAIHTMETFSTLTSSVGYIAGYWGACYDGIARANDAIKRISAVSADEFPKKEERLGELYFIRGHFHFLLKILFSNIAYIDENCADPAFEPNTLGNDALWNKIAADFELAADKLPVNKTDMGRADYYAACAYLAKTRLYQAYEQDANFNVVNINKSRLEDVIKYCDEVINSGIYGLNADYAENFLVETKNGKESIFAVQYSYGDGTAYGRINRVAGLNYNMNEKYGCCDFHNPSYSMVNAYKTDANGLPRFDDYNDEVMQKYEDFWTNTVDPRVDHSVGSVGHPFKYTPDYIYAENWRRVPETYGYFSTMKEIVLSTDPSYTKFGAYMGSGLNAVVLRYDDVLLWKAEALIQLDRQDEALPLINQVRQRAANSTARLVMADGDPISNYNIDTYKPGVNCTWTKEYAFEALKWERRLEFAFEGVRFFDLVRWGIAAETINDYFAVESERFMHLDGAKFTKNRDEYLPIPYSEIVYSKNNLVQNPGF